MNLTYFDSNEELFAKFRINRGKGYDLIAVSDATQEMMIKEGMLQELNFGLIPNANSINKKLLGHSFDPENRYGIPYLWSVYGIIFNKNLTHQIPLNKSWSLVFKDPRISIVPNTSTENEPNKICMLELPKESIFVASIYLFERIKNITDQELMQIKNLLLEQKKWVEVYMFSSLQYYLLGDVVSIAVTSSAYAKKIFEISDNFDFFIPKEGSILTIDCLAIPKASQKTELAHKFIDFLISKENSLHNSELYGYNPANKDALSEAKKHFESNRSFFPDNEMFNKLHIMHNEIDIKKIEHLWLSVRLA